MRTRAPMLLLAVALGCSSGSDPEPANPPLVDSFEPSTGCEGMRILVYGSNFLPITSISFGGVESTNFFQMGETVVEVTVPVGAATGPIRVTTEGGTGSSTGSFTVVPPFWTERESGVTDALLGVTASGSRLVAVGSNGAILTSDDDAASWTPRFSGTSQPLFGVAASPSLYVAVGGYGACTHTLLTSADGGTWTAPKTTAYACSPPPPPPPIGCGCGSADGLHAVTWTGTQFVVVGGHLGSGQIYTSPTGAACEWTARAGADLAYSSCSCPTCDPIPEPLWAAAASDALHVAIGDAPVLSCSATGADWSADNFTRSGVPTANMAGLLWTGSHFVAVGYGGLIHLSANGYDWQNRPSGTLEHLFGVAWSGDELVAVGRGGITLSSSDGMTWAREATPFTADLNAVTWDGRQFVAVGQGGIVLTAP